MPGIDKWPDIVAWVAGIGVLVGGSIAGYFGTKLSGHKPSDDDRDDRDREERDKRYKLERKIEIAELRHDLEQVIASLREAIIGKLDRQEGVFRQEIRGQEDRIQQLERDVAVLEQRRGGPR